MPMTAPIMPCTCGTAHLGDCPGELSLCLRPGRVFDGSIQLRNKTTKLPEDWPAGMTARLWFSWGTGTELIIEGTVDGSWLRFHMSPAETELVPRGALARVELNYTGVEDEWVTWREGRLGSC